MFLNDGQRAHFATFGFLVRRQLFTADEVTRIRRAFDRTLANSRMGEAFSGERRQLVLGFVEHEPDLLRLLDDERVFSTLEGLLGPGFTWLGSDGNLYVGDTGWHTDAKLPNYDTLKAAFYLEPVGLDTGCLRVIPGSHRLPLHDTVKPVTQFGVAPEEIPAVPLESEPGDVVFFNRSIWHASFGGKAGRPMFTLTCVAAPDSAERVAYLQQTYQNKVTTLGRLPFGQPPDVYGPAILNSDIPRIRAMAAKLVELGFS